MADVSVLKTDDPLLEHVFRRGFERIDERFDQLAESLEALRVHMHRRFDEAEVARKADRQMFYDILGNHEGRIRGLEDASGRSA